MRPNMLRGALSTFMLLVKRDLHVVAGEFVSNLVNSASFVFFQAVVYVYLMPVMGMKAEAVPPVFIGSALVSVLFVISYSRAFLDASDIAFGGLVKHHMLTPIPMWLLLAKYIVSTSIESLLYSAPLFFFSKLILGSQLVISKIAFVPFFMLYILGVVFASQLLFIAVLYFSFNDFRNDIWPRVILPALFLGCQIYTFQAVETLFPLFSKVFLLNPVVYFIEGVRASLFGAEGYLDPALCITVLVTVNTLLWIVLRWAARRKFDHV